MEGEGGGGGLRPTANNIIFIFIHFCLTVELVTLSRHWHLVMLFAALFAGHF